MSFIGFDECLLKKYFDQGANLLFRKFEGLNWPTLTILMTKMSIYSTGYIMKTYMHAHKTSESIREK
jgi:glucose-6-phosphate isomerase